MLRKNLNTTLITLSAMTVWALYAYAYILLKNNPNTVALAAYFSLIGEAGLDVVVAILVFRLWKKTEELDTKRILLFFFIAFIAAIAADGIYNIVLNLFQFQYINPIVVSLFDVPFALFLLFQAMAWSWVLFSSRETTIIAGKWS